MEIVADKIEMARLREMARNHFGDLVKAVVDVERAVMAVDGEMQADEERMLLENGSSQENLWGLNLYPDIEGPDWIEFDSMINLRPWQWNNSRGADGPELRHRIVAIVEGLVGRCKILFKAYSLPAAKANNGYLSFLALSDRPERA